MSAHLRWREVPASLDEVHVHLRERQEPVRRVEEGQRDVDADDVPVVEPPKDTNE